MEKQNSLSILQPLALKSIIISVIFVFLIGYFVSFNRWPITSILVILLISLIITFFWKKKRKTLLQRGLVLIPALLIGFIYGISGLKLPKEIPIMPIFFSLVLIVLASYIIIWLRNAAKNNIHDVSLKIMGYISGIGSILLGGFLSYGSIVYEENSPSFLIIPGAIFILLGMISLYYAYKIKRNK